VLSATKAAQVDWLVTGDRHLLDASDMIPSTVLTVAEALVRARELLSEASQSDTLA
jgi:predicted nucleic acid-binding protein